MYSCIFLFQLGQDAIRVEEQPSIFIMMCILSLRQGKIVILHSVRK